MKRILILISVLIAYANVYATEQTQSSTDILNLGPRGDFVITQGGGILVSTTIIQGSLSVIEGITNEYQKWVAPAAASQTQIFNTYITTNVLSGGGTTFYDNASRTSDFTQLTSSADGSVSYVGRNLSVICAWSVGNSTHSSTNGTVLFNGINCKGSAVTETVYLSTGIVYSLNAFTHITSMVIKLPNFAEIVQSSISVSIGVGPKVGLYNSIDDATDIYRVSEKGADVLPTAITVDDTYDTVTFVTAPDGKESREVWYRAVSR